MIQHVWSVFCSKTVIDKESNNVTIVETLERLAIQPPPGAEGPGLIPIRCELITLWARQQLDTPVTGIGRVRLMGPGNFELLSKQHDINLNGSPRSRHRMRLNGIRLLPGGEHWWEVSFRVGDQEWQVAARVSVEVAIAPPAEPQE